MNDTAEAEVMTRIEGGVGRITLNRPKALHALNAVMCHAMVEALLAWRADPAVGCILIDHAGERGFCAGGDIRMLAQSGRQDGKAARAFFHIEYQLNHLLFTFPKPVVTVMDGVTMGGGVGLSAPADHRIATQHTTYAMPESGIGLFPDVGGGWFLPRLPGKTGLWLGLTGARLKAADCVALGIANAYVPAERLDRLKASLLEGAAPADAVASAAAAPGPPPLAHHRDAIDRLFGAPTLAGIFDALAADGSEWAAAQLAILATKSPQTLAVTFRELELGAACASFAEEMEMEYRIAARIVRTPDFIEGVRAVIVDKDNAPRWNPAAVADVRPSDIDALFAQLPADEAWRPVG